MESTDKPVIEVPVPGQRQRARLTAERLWLLGRRRLPLSPARGRRLNRRLGRVESLLGLTTTSAYPSRMYLELTRRCNLSCPICGRTMTKNEDRDMPPELFDRLLPALPWMEALTFSLLGESLLSPLLPQVLERCPDGLETRLLSNGAALTEEKAEQLIRLRLKHIMISIEATNPATYEYVRGWDGFDTVTGNIRQLADLKQRMNSSWPVITLLFAGLRANIDELPEFVRQAKRWGAQQVGLGFLQVLSPRWMEESLLLDRERCNRRFEEAWAVSQEEGMVLGIPPGFDLRYPASWNYYSGHCRFPWEFLTVDYRGETYPCTMLYNSWGNLLERDFQGIWNGPEARAFRRRVNTSQRPDWCLACLECDTRESNNAPQHITLLREDNELRSLAEMKACWEAAQPH